MEFHQSVNHDGVREKLAPEAKQRLQEVMRRILADEAVDFIFSAQYVDEKQPERIQIADLHAGGLVPLMALALRANARLYNAVDAAGA